ncbi:hypothetical protein MWU59_13060 [Flavobacteriaceae bacterium F08102]|nr:hypothetical protein [Flavobacteriaceae bacterium F08102]
MNKKFSKVILFMVFMMVTSAIYSQGTPPKPGVVPPNPVPIPGVFAMIIAGVTYGYMKLKKKE